MSSTLSLFSSVHAVLGLLLPDCLEVEPVSSIFLTSLLTLCLDYFFPGNSFTILAPRHPFSLKCVCVCVCVCACVCVCVLVCYVFNIHIHACVCVCGGGVAGVVGGGFLLCF